MEKIKCVVTEPGSSRKNKTGSWRTFKPLVDKQKCIGCGTCAKFCPDSCIEVKNKKAVIDYDYCKGCLICVEICPVKAISKEVEKK